MTLIKSISGIRGTIGGKTSFNLTPLDTVLFTSAYACWLKKIFKAKNLIFHEEDGCKKDVFELKTCDLACFPSLLSAIFIL